MILISYYAWLSGRNIAVYLDASASACWCCNRVMAANALIC